MQLSIIIVNYNVRNFIDLCLLSVKEAITNIQAEVFVVDNNSSDDSVEYLKEHHNWIQLIENKDNPGFSKANNQAIKKAKGKYILLLNPDTIVEENTFEDCINFMDKTPNAGGLGVKMIGADGSFQPESKRGIPTPMVSFYKMSGLAKLFPNSKCFAHYNLSYLSENEINEIEILSGAFMFLRKSVLDKIGLLDERFFMYGEDIDLSYRIIKAGFDNYYFPKTKILHFKGESTKKQNTKYIYIFYNAMILFAEKHFSSKKTKIFIWFIQLAVYLRIAISIFIMFCTKFFTKRSKSFSYTNENILIIANFNTIPKIEFTLKKEFKHNNIFSIEINNTNELNYSVKVKEFVKNNKITYVVFSHLISKKILLELINLLSNKYVHFNIINTDNNILIIK